LPTPPTKIKSRDKSLDSKREVEEEEEKEEEGFKGGGEAYEKIRGCKMANS